MDTKVVCLKRVLKFSFILLILCTLSFGGSYTVIVSENGNSLVTAEFIGDGTLLGIPLPIDVEDVVVTGALYVPTSQGIEISFEQGNSAIVLFESSLLVTRSGEDWKFSMDLASGTNSVTVSLPKGASIKTMNPQGQVSQTENSVNIVWQTSDNSISAQYTLSASLTGDYTLYIIVIALAGVIIFGLRMYTIMKKKVVKERKAPEKKVSGKENVVKTLSQNQRKIVGILMEYKQGIKRNKLEKLVGLSKSSLAATLNQLEKRKVVDMDKSGKVHYVQLSEWFKKL